MACRSSNKEAIRTQLHEESLHDELNMDRRAFRKREYSQGEALQSMNKSFRRDLSKEAMRARLHEDSIDSELDMDRRSVRKWEDLQGQALQTLNKSFRGDLSKDAMRARRHEDSLDNVIAEQFDEVAAVQVKPSVRCKSQHSYAHSLTAIKHSHVPLA